MYQTQITPSILILTGPPAAGKSTIGQLIAKQQTRCAVIDVDLLRAMVVQPHVAPWRGEAGMAQLRLGVQNACAVARNCVDAGFSVVLLDVLTDETAALYRTAFNNLQCRIVLLLPSLAISMQRNQQRGQFLTDGEVALLYEWQQGLTDYDKRIDNSMQRAEKVAANIITYAMEENRL